MATSSNGSRSKVDEALDALLKKRAKHSEKVTSADAERKQTVEAANEKWQKQVGKSPKKLAKIDKKLARLVERYRYSLTRRHSKTIKRALGEVKVVLRAAELEMPADEMPVVNAIMQRRGWKEKYLIPTFKVNRSALRQAPSDVITYLRGLGVWRGKHWTVLVKSPANSSLKTISSQRFNERTQKTGLLK